MATDRHLTAFRRGPLQWDPPALDAIPLIPGNTHSLRGPRQAGKTTTVKRLIARILARPGARVLYLSCDILGGYQELAGILARAKQLHPAPEGPWHIFLDEVSSVSEWQRGIKWAWDQGVTRDDFILLTGSSARDVRAGAERLPGRRGDGADYLQLPLSFRDFCVHAEGLQLPPALGIDDVFSPAGGTAIKSAYQGFAELSRALNRYLRSGGYPAAVTDLMTGSPTPRMETVRMLWDVVAGDIASLRYDRAAALKLLEEVTISLGAPFAWSHVSKAMGLRDPDSARLYTERLAENFILLPVYFWDESGAFQPRKQRKVFFIDPLFAAIPSGLVPGARQPNDDGLIENAVAAALFRSAATSLVQAVAEPGAIGYWKSSHGREVDFVVPSRGWRRLGIEVKGDNRSAISYARSAIARGIGRGIVVSRSAFVPGGDVPVVPVSVLLAVLEERPRREILVDLEPEGLAVRTELVGGSLETVRGPEATG